MEQINTSSIQNLISEGLNFLVEVVLFFLSVIVIIFLFGWLLDRSKKDRYKIKVMARTTPDLPGQGSTYYVNYWVWQRNKRKAATEELKRSGVNQVFFGHALKKKFFERSRIPFREEAYGTPSQK